MTPTHGAACGCSAAVHAPMTDPAHNRPIMQDEKTHASPRLGLLSVFGKVELLLWVALYLCRGYVIQFHIVAAPHDADTAYHAAVGSLIREHGILQSFPWTPFSWLSDHYADKELLFHLLFVPFIGLGWITASKLVGMLLGAVLLAVLYLILRAESSASRASGPWFLSSPRMCSSFVSRSSALI